MTGGDGDDIAISSQTLSRYRDTKNSPDSGPTVVQRRLSSGEQLHQLMRLSVLMLNTTMYKDTIFALEYAKTRLLS